mgnify:CR=1 FL=1
MTRWSLLLLLAAALSACDDGFTPRADDGRAFALYGTLDGRATHQMIRVQDLAGSVLDTPDQLPVTVTSTELVSGQTTTWRDSVVTLPDGIRAHLFVADLAVAPGDIHRIEAVRDADGARSVVTATVSAPVVTSGASPPGSSNAAPVVLYVADGRLEGPRVRFVVRRSDADDNASFVTQPTPQEGGGRTSFLSFLDSAELQATRLLYGSTPGDPVFVGAQLEGVVVGTAPTPVIGGVGSIGWVYPISLPIPFPTLTVTRVGFVDGR